MNIKLIAPDMRWESAISSAEYHKVEKTNLPLLAALTPPGHTIKIVDESFVPDNPGEDVDLVGITVMTELVPRAYRIAEDYRRRGAKVVMGGIHPTVLPEEALRYADAVVVGEGETSWPRLVMDAAAGRLQQIYCPAAWTDLSTLPMPKRELYPRSVGRSYTPTATGIETARGCPFDCEFCSTTHVLGKKFRVRPVQEVIRELETIPNPYLFFVDDSIGLNRDVAGRLFSEMVPFQKQWIGQATAGLAEDPELLRLMKQSGCEGVIIGFESVDPKNQEKLKKIHSLKVTSSEAVHRFHDQGIPILGAFVFGFDYEDKSIFERTIAFALTERLDGVQLRILTPFPGTRLYERLLRERRIFDPLWWLKGYAPGTLHYRLAGMAPDEFLDGFNWMVKELFSYRNIFRRFFGIAPWRRSGMGMALYAGVNYGNRRRYFKEFEIGHPDFSRPLDQPDGSFVYQKK
jgi:radical SAM superfamily enzyme YgiQ (UPF0313 family)